jgi:SAM-dependent methyltransferase
MPQTDKAWQSPDLAQLYLDGVRGAIPLAAEQIDVMRRVVQATQPDLRRRVLDLGCGDGLLGRALLEAYPGARVVFVDFAAAMLDAARARMDGASGGHAFLQQDYGDPAWVESVRGYAPFDVVLSGFSIHHQPDTRKQALYGEIYDLLAPGGVFVNIEHVASASAVGKALFDDLFVDALHAFHQGRGSTRTGDDLRREYYARPDKDDNILAPVETQCRWLRALGFVDVDCFMKIFELAVFGGRKPR